MQLIAVINSSISKRRHFSKAIQCPSNTNFPLGIEYLVDDDWQQTERPVAKGRACETHQISDPLTDKNIGLHSGLPRTSAASSWYLLLLRGPWSVRSTNPLLTHSQWSRRERLEREEKTRLRSAHSSRRSVSVARTRLTHIPRLKISVQ